MTSITQPPTRRSRASRGFTLVELIITASLSTVIMAAILTAVIFLTRSSYRSAAYAEMDAQSRIALERFARDARMASWAAWTSSSSVTLSIPTNASGTIMKVQYTHDPLNKRFTRQIVHPTTGGTEVLITGVTDFQFRAYTIAGAEIADLVTGANSTKQIQLSLKSVRQRSTTADTTSKVLSARYILRNKRVS